MEYYVYMTNDCNLNCQYCSVLFDTAKKGVPTTPNYSYSKLIELINTTQKNEEDKEVAIYLFGGEPTLEYCASLKLINLLQEHLVVYSLKFILHTNGLLLDKISDELLDKLTAVICSINYEMIPQHSFANSYIQKILDNLVLTKMRKDLTIIGRMTITEETSLYTELMQFAPFVDYIYWQIENKYKFSNYRDFYATYTYETKMTFIYWMKYMQNGFLLKYVPFMSVMKFLILYDKYEMEFSCGYGSGMIYIQTDGNCYACSDSIESERHYIGDIYKGVALNKPSLNDLRCARCSYRYLCFGRCGRMHKEFSEQQISRYCALNKFMFQLFIDKKDAIREIIKSNPLIVDELNAKELNFTELTP
jgi:radical SAM protein with 4Fe4S-binding SPASM domain